MPRKGPAQRRELIADPIYRSRYSIDQQGHVARQEEHR
jgi:hypothetical protein